MKTKQSCREIIKPATLLLAGLLAAASTALAADEICASCGQQVSVSGEPNPAFDGSTPLQVVERGETDRVWRMVYELESGEPG